MSEQPPSQPDQPTPPGGFPPPPPPAYQQYQQGQPTYPQPGQQPGYPAYQQPGGYQKPRKKRPRAWWFAVGAILLIAGVAIGIAVLATTVSGVIEEDGVITANGRPATIDAPAGKQRMLFAPTGDRAPSCSLTDGTGKELTQSPVFGEATLSTGGTQWEAFSKVDSSGDGQVTITCTPTTTGDGSQVQVRMGAPFDVRGLGGRVVGGLAALFLLGGSGFLVLLVTTILWFTRKPVPQA